MIKQSLDRAMWNIAVTVLPNKTLHLKPLFRLREARIPYNSYLAIENSDLKSENAYFLKG